MIIVGIDPGITGAVAFYDMRRTSVVLTRDLPVTAKAIGKGQQIDAPGLNELLSAITIEHAFVEEQRPMPKQGVTSMLSLGRTIGVIEGVLGARNIPLTLVAPTAWKRAAGLIKTEKDRSRTRALQLFPVMASELSRKKDHGRAEAMLIAWYGATRIIGQIYQQTA